MTTAVPAQGQDSGRTYQSGDRLLLRTLAAAGMGVVIGAPIAGVIALAVPDCPGCEDPGLEELFWGAAIGWTVGTGIGAAMPSLDGRCAASTRRARGLIGAALASLGAALGVMTCERRA